jgi:hypothetical protein
MDPSHTIPSRYDHILVTPAFVDRCSKMWGTVMPGSQCTFPCQTTKLLGQLQSHGAADCDDVDWIYNGGDGCYGEKYLYCCCWSFIRLHFPSRSKLPRLLLRLGIHFVTALLRLLLGRGSKPHVQNNRHCSVWSQDKYFREYTGTGAPTSVVKLVTTQNVAADISDKFGFAMLIVLFHLQSACFLSMF